MNAEDILRSFIHRHKTKKQTNKNYKTGHENF